MTVYYRPLLSDDPVAPAGALRIAGGWTWASHAQITTRTTSSVEESVIPVSDLPDEVAQRLSATRPDFAGISMSAPRIMSILNTTPDSFSDGGEHLAHDDAIRRAQAIFTEGADIIDIGGESTRPGAATVAPAEEIARTEPVIVAVSPNALVSIDTRKAEVARAALSAGATIVNDVSALSYDAAMAGTVAEAEAPVILMHAQGTPETMQDAPAYADVLLDVYDTLAARIAFAEGAGIPRSRIAVDPGIGFGKTLEHNLALLSGLSLFHGLGCPIVLGASRKRFIGTLTDAPDAANRVAGSVAVALAAIAQGVQIVRVHDTLATKQALTLWRASRGQ